MVFDAWKQKISAWFAEGKQALSQRAAHFKYQPSNKNIVGLDIGQDALKLLRINTSNSKYQVENFSIMPISSGVIVKDEIKEPIALASAINQLFRQSGSTSKNVALAVPKANAMIKTVTIDSRLSTDEIESRAWIEASNLYPDMLGDIYLDFTVPGRSKQDPSQLELVLVACRKDQINPYLEILKQAGVEPKIVDVNCYALERAMPFAISPNLQLETIALLNLNLNLSTFIVMQNRQLIHAHDQSYDGQRLLTQVHNYLREKGLNEKEISRDDEAYKALIEDKRYTDILRENLISQLRHLLHYFYSSHPNLPIQQIILAGDCAFVPHLILFIQREMNIETILANPFNNMDLAPQINADQLTSHAPALMLCCGLALA